MIIWHVFIFNCVEFTQGKLRIARDTTVNDYLCCKGVKCLGLYLVSFTHSSLTVTRVICPSMRRRECKLFNTSVIYVAYLPISGSYFSRCLFLKRHL